MKPNLMHFKTKWRWLIHWQPILVGALGLALSAIPLPAAETAPVISLPASAVPFQMTLPAPDNFVVNPTEQYQLVDTESPQTTYAVGFIPALNELGLPIEKSWQMAVTVKSGKSHQLRLQINSDPATTASTGEPGFRFSTPKPGDKALGLYEGKRPVLVYNQGVQGRAGVPADRNRSTYVHPLYGLDGEVLTDDFPKDHYHHRGLFWAWPHIKIEGQESSLWDLRGIRHQFDRWLTRQASPTVAVLGIENGWYRNEQKVMLERVWLRVYPAVEQQQSIDLEFIWIPIDKDVTLAGAEGKSYGGLTLRYAPGERVVITTPLGQQAEDFYMKRLPWADLTAQFRGASNRSGAAIFIHPQHPDYPPTWLTRHYGVLCVGWPGVTSLTFKPGEPIHCAYRIWLHKNEPTPARLEETYQAYRSIQSIQWSNSP